MEPVDVPKSLADPSVRAARQLMLHAPHVAALTKYVEVLRADAGPDAGIPYFDPLDGGVDAEILFLLEAPGPKAVSSGFISRDNPDGTAKNLFELCQAAGLERRRTVLWNVVPWYIGTGTNIRAATPADLQAGLRPLQRLLELLPQLNTVVLLGRSAEKAMHQLDSGRYRVLVSPHPSPLFVNNAPGNREKILSVLTNVRAAAVAEPEAVASQSAQERAGLRSEIVAALHEKLKALEFELHAQGLRHLQLHQQSKVAGNMSFSGANGRIWIQPTGDSIDISLSGKSLTAMMTPVMVALCGHACDGYKQTNRARGKRDQPFWRVQGLSVIREALKSYAKTTP